MNYFTRIRKSLLLLLISLLIQACDKVCIKSNDFGEQSNTDLFKISARDLSDCAFSYDSSSGSYDNMPESILKKCMEGYRYNEDSGKYSEKRVETVYSLIKGGFFDLENSSIIFDNFEKKLKEQESKYNDFKDGYYCQDFDFLSDNNSKFVSDFESSSDLINQGDLVELNRKIYMECGNYCSNVCSGSLSTNNSSFDAATFSQLSWPHSTLKSTSSYYGINFKKTSTFKVEATGKIQTNGMTTGIDGYNSRIAINKNPYVPEYNLSTDTVWKETDKAELFAKIELPESLSKDDEFLNRFYLDFANFSTTQLSLSSAPVICDGTNFNMPNYAAKIDNKTDYFGKLVFFEPKYSAIFCNYSKVSSVCEYEVNYGKMLNEIGCLSKVISLDKFDNLIDIKPFTDFQKTYYKYAVNNLNDSEETTDKKFVLNKSEEEKSKTFVAGTGTTNLNYYEYSYSDNNRETILEYTISEVNSNYVGDRIFEFGNGLNMPFKVYIKSDNDNLSSSNKCDFKVNSTNSIDGLINNKTNLLTDISDISYDDISITSSDTWYPVKQNTVPAIINEYYSDTVVNNDFVVTLKTSTANCFDKLTIKIVPLNEIKVDKTGFIFFRNVLGDVSGNNIKFQVINPDIKGIINKIDEFSRDSENPNIDDYKKEVRANYFEYYKYNKSRTNSADIINDTFTTITTIAKEDLKNVELLGTVKKENIGNYDSIYHNNAVFVRKGQIIRFDDSNWLNTNDLTIKTKVYDGENIASNIDLIYFIKERPAMMCLSDKINRNVEISKLCKSDIIYKKLYVDSSDTGDSYLCNIDIEKETNEDSNVCFINVVDSTVDGSSNPFTKLEYFEKVDDKYLSKNIDFVSGENGAKIKYLNVAETFNVTMQYLYSLTNFLDKNITVYATNTDKLKSILNTYISLIDELNTKFTGCLGASGTENDIFIVKDKIEKNEQKLSDSDDSDTITLTVENGYMKLNKDELKTYLDGIKSAISKVISDSNGDKLTNQVELLTINGKLKTAIYNNADIKQYETLNNDPTVFYTLNYSDPKAMSGIKCDEMYEKDTQDYKDCTEMMKDSGKKDKEDSIILSFGLRLFDSLKDDNCDQKEGICKKELITCLNFSDYFGSVFNFDDIINNVDGKKFDYDLDFATNYENIISGFNIAGSKKVGGDLTTFKVSNKYNEKEDADNIIACSNDSSTNCKNEYKIESISISERVFPRFLDLNKDFLFPISTTTSNGEKALSFKITSEDKKSNGENLALFVGPADNLYDIDQDGHLCLSNGGDTCTVANLNDIVWLIGYDELVPTNGKLSPKEENAFKFDINGQLIKINENSSLISINDIINNNMIPNDKGYYNIAFFFKILDENRDDKDNGGFYTIKITESSGSGVEDIKQSWFERRQALSDSSVNFELDEPVSVINLLFNSVLGIMDGESYGIRNDEKKCTKTLDRLQNDREICFIHGYDENDTLNGKSCGTDGISGYEGTGMSAIVSEYCFESCDQIRGNEVGVKCNIVYNNGGILKLLYVNIIQNTLYQFIVKIALVLMLTLYGLGYFLGLSEFNQKEIMTRILRACCIYVLISNGGWALYDKFVVSFFKQGIDSLLFLIASSFETGAFNYIEDAIMNNDYSVKLILFSSTFDNIKILFSEAVLYKILGLIFSGWLGILYAYLVLTGLITYIVGMFNAIALYLMAQMFMSITLSIGPMIFLLMFFERTKGSFDNWLSILIGFALQEIFIIITVSFFNNLIYSIIKTVFAYPVCILPILDINLLGVPLSLIQFWKVPGTGFGGNILDLQNQAGPSFYSILLFYIVANLSNKFVSEMAELGNDIGDGIKVTDVAGPLTGAISGIGNKINGTIEGVASAPIKRMAGATNKWADNLRKQAKTNFDDKRQALNEARTTPIKNELEEQLKRGVGEENLLNLYNDAHKRDAGKDAKQKYKEELSRVVENQRLEKLMANKKVDEAFKGYLKDKGIVEGEFNNEEKRVLKEYFLGEKGYVNKGNMSSEKREAVEELIDSGKRLGALGRTNGFSKFKEEGVDRYAEAKNRLSEVSKPKRNEEVNNGEIKDKGETIDRDMPKDGKKPLTTADFSLKNSLNNNVTENSEPAAEPKKPVVSNETVKATRSDIKPNAKSTTSRVKEETQNDNNDGNVGDETETSLKNNSETYGRGGSGGTDGNDTSSTPLEEEIVSENIVAKEATSTNDGGDEVVEKIEENENTNIASEKTPETQPEEADNVNSRAGEGLKAEEKNSEIPNTEVNTDKNSDESPDDNKSSEIERPDPFNNPNNHSSDIEETDEEVMDYRYSRMGIDED